jgi:hypothetical protein
MNAFLLKVAINEMLELSKEKGDTEYNSKLTALSTSSITTYSSMHGRRIFRQDTV